MKLTDFACSSTNIFFLLIDFHICIAYYIKRVDFCFCEHNIYQTFRQTLYSHENKRNINKNNTKIFYLLYFPGKSIILLSYKWELKRKVCF